MHLMEMCQGQSVKVLCLIYTHQCLFVYLIREEQVEKNRRVLRNYVCQLALVLKLKVVTLLQHFYCVCIQHTKWQNIELEGDTRQNSITLQKYNIYNGQDIGIKSIQTPLFCKLWHWACNFLIITILLL